MPFEGRKQKTRPLTTPELKAMLRERYPRDAYAFMEEVPNGTGGNRSRTADALVMSLWPSRGLHLYGFEIKASRQDWLSELKRPAKADAVARYCDFWFLVAGSRDIVQRGELPPTWGLLVPHAGKLKVEVEATRLEAVPITRAFLAALFRAAQENIVPDAVLRRAEHAAREDGIKRGRESNEWQLKHLQEKVDKFREEFGVTPDAWNFPTLKEAIALVRSGDLSSCRARLDDIRKTAERIIEVVEKHNAGGA